MQVVSSDDVDMDDIDDQQYNEQYLNLFCLVKVRRQLPSSYQTEEEILIAHFQTQICGDPSTMSA